MCSGKAGGTTGHTPKGWGAWRTGVSSSQLPGRELGGQVPPSHSCFSSWGSATGSVDASSKDTGCGVSACFPRSSVQHAQTRVTTGHPGVEVARHGHSGPFNCACERSVHTRHARAQSSHCLNVKKQVRQDEGGRRASSQGFAGCVGVPRSDVTRQRLPPCARVCGPCRARAAQVSGTSVVLHGACLPE